MKKHHARRHNYRSEKVFAVRYPLLRPTSARG